MASFLLRHQSPQTHTTFDLELIYFLIYSATIRVKYYKPSGCFYSLSYVPQIQE